MYETLVSVANFTESTRLSFEKKGLGVELSSFSYPEKLTKSFIKESISKHKDLLEGFQNRVTMHGAFYDLVLTARDPMIVDVCRFRIRQSMEIAAELGIKEMVFHSNYFPSTRSDFRLMWEDRQVAFWAEFIPIVEELGLRLFIENTREEDASFIANVLQRIDHPQFKTCYDTGHSNCFTTQKVPAEEWVKTYGAQLGYVHLHSNDGARDLHHSFTKGPYSFDAFFEELAKLEEKPLMIIEVKSKEDYLLSYEGLDALGLIKR